MKIGVVTNNYDEYLIFYSGNKNLDLIWIHSRESYTNGECDMFIKLSGAKNVPDDVLGAINAFESVQGKIKSSANDERELRKIVRVMIKEIKKTEDDFTFTVDPRTFHSNAAVIPSGASFCVTPDVISGNEAFQPARASDIDKRLKELRDKLSGNNDVD